MLSPSMEDYLKVIFRLSQGARGPRVSEIADAIQVRKPSVSKALRRLSESGYVEHVPYGEVALTDRGERVAIRQVHAFEVIADFLEQVLGLSREEAEKEAGGIEHCTGPETVHRLEHFLQFVRSAPPEARGWVEGFVASIPARESAGGEGPDDFIEGERSWTSPV